MSLANKKMIDLFAGIGGIRLAFEDFGAKCVFSSEIDRDACNTYFENFGEKPEGDITQIPSSAIPEHDILLAGFPCQPFSIIGKRKGLSDTRGTLFFDIARIIKDKRPEIVFLENVPQLLTIQKGYAFNTIKTSLEKLGYYVHHKILNSLDFGIPQSRKRLFIIAFDRKLHFTFPVDKIPYNLEMILENSNDIESSYEASDYIKQKRLKAVEGKNVFYPSVWHENKAGNVSVLDYSCALRANASYNYLLVNGHRHFTPLELKRLQGFPDDFIITGSYTKIRKQTGNSVPVHVIRALAKAIDKSLIENDVLPDNINSKNQYLLEFEKCNG